MNKESVSTIGVSIIEDDSRARRILANCIRQSKDFSFVSEYSSGEYALLNLPQEKPDVVLMDINLTGISGIECVRRLKPLLSKTQFVMLTVYEDADHIFDALAAGATGYLLKRTPWEDLLTAIKDVHSGFSPMSGNIARKVVQSFQPPSLQTDAPDALSPRERQVLEFLVRGYLYKEIADTIKVSVFTVNAHIRHIYEKLHVRSRGQAVAKYKRFSQEN